MMIDTLSRPMTPDAVAAPRLAPHFTGSGWRIVSGPEAYAMHRALAAEAVAFGAAQGPHWTEAWGAQNESELVYVVLVEEGQPVLSLPLEIRRDRHVTVATIPGGSHANGSFPALRQGFKAELDMDELGRTLRDHCPEIDVLALERMRPSMSDVANPFLPHATNTSVDADLAADLEGGFGAWLDRNSGKNKRKKHRQDHDAMAAEGVVNIKVVRSPLEAKALLDTFFAMKGRRFTEIGVEDVFADAAVQRFFHRLVREGLTDTANRFDLTVLRVGQRVIAIAGHSILPDRMVCEFSSFEPIETPIRSVSPSLYMHYESIERAAQAGLRYYDFSVGEDEYKKRWCDTRTEFFDVVIGLSLAGRSRALRHRLLADAKRRIKARPTLMRWIRRMRRGK